MKRSLQEYVELVVFGLIALLVGTGLLWLLGWVLSLGGIVLKGLAGLLWMLLRFVVPVAIAGGLVYFLVKAAQDRQKPSASTTAGAGTNPPATGVIDVAPGAGAAASQAAAGTSAAAGTVDAAADAVASTANSTARAVGSAVESAAADTVELVDGAADAAADGVADVNDTLTHDEDDDTVA